MHVKNYRSANLLACNQFISDLFPCKMGLGRVGGEKQSFRAKQGGKSKSSCRPGWQTPRWPEAGCPEVQWPESQECPEPPRESSHEKSSISNVNAGAKATNEKLFNKVVILQSSLEVILIITNSLQI